MPYMPGVDLYVSVHRGPPRGGRYEGPCPIIWGCILAPPAHHLLFENTEVTVTWHVGEGVYEGSTWTTFEAAVVAFGFHSAIYQIIAVAHHEEEDDEGILLVDEENSSGDEDLLSDEVAEEGLESEYEDIVEEDPPSEYEYVVEEDPPSEHEEVQETE